VNKNTRLYNFRPQKGITILAAALLQSSYRVAKLSKAEARLQQGRGKEVARKVRK